MSGPAVDVRSRPLTSIPCVTKFQRLARASHFLSRISGADSRVALMVVPTDEELMIAQHTVALLSEQSGGGATGQRLAV